MAKFIVDYTEERWFSIEIEADTEEEASEKFWMGDCDFEKAENIGGEIQQSIQVTEKEKVA